MQYLLYLGIILDQACIVISCSLTSTNFGTLAWGALLRVEDEEVDGAGSAADWLDSGAFRLVFVGAIINSYQINLTVSEETILTKI